MSATTACDPTPTRLKRFLSVREAALFSGLGMTTIRKLLTAGRLRKYKPLAGRVLVDSVELEQFVLASAG